MLVSKIFTFDSAHQLPNYKGSCERLHGHTFKLIVTLEGDVDKKTGMVFDFLELKRIVDEKVIAKLDHNYLNEIIKNPTCENILIWICEQLKSEQKLKKLTLYESEDSFCELEC